MSKQKNYSDAEVARMVEVYTAESVQTQADREAAVEALHVELDRPIASIRSKLAHEGVYIAKPKPQPKGGRTKKSDLVQRIADEADMKNDSFFDSLEGANKAVLEWIIDLQDEVAELREADSEESTEGA